MTERKDALAWAKEHNERHQNVFPRPVITGDAAINELEVSLDDPATKDAAMTVLRDLIDEVVLEPGEGDTMRAKLSGVFPALLELCTKAARSKPRGRKNQKTRHDSAGSLIASSCEMSLVAGTGFELTTTPL